MEEKTQKLDLFDRFIDQFSARELKTRVWGVFLLGILLTCLAVAGLYLLFTHDFYVTDKPGMQAVPFINLLEK